MSTANMMPTPATHPSIDQRLDAIDRILLGWLPRPDRLELLAHVEARVRELAAANPAIATNLEAPSESLTLPISAILNSTTGSPAYLSNQQSVVPAACGTISSIPKKRSRLALSAGVLGILALVLLFAFPLTYFTVDFMGGSLGEFLSFSLLGVHAVAVAMGGVAAVVLGVSALISLGRRRENLEGHGWAITGLCTGTLPTFAGGMAVLLLATQLLSAPYFQTPATSDNVDALQEPPPLPDPMASITSPAVTNPTADQPAPSVGLSQPPVQSAGHEVPAGAMQPAPSEPSGLVPTPPEYPSLPRHAQPEPQLKSGSLPQAETQPGPRPEPPPEPVSPPESVPAISI